MRYLLLSLLLLLSSCTNKRPAFNYFVGTWESKAGGQIVLNADSSCIVQNVNDISGSRERRFMSHLGKRKRKNK